MEEVAGPELSLTPGHHIGGLCSGPEERQALGGVVEWVLTEGDSEESLRNEGFLDDLTDSEMYARPTHIPADFVKWSGPEARRHPSARRLL
jgi:hypothetical protein